MPINFEAYGLRMIADSLNVANLIELGKERFEIEKELYRLGKITDEEYIQLLHGREKNVEATMENIMKIIGGNLNVRTGAVCDCERTQYAE